MKALYCSECGDIRAPDPSGEWTYCRCGQAAMRWVDPVKGIAKVKADYRDSVRVIGIDNAFLRFSILTPNPTNEDWRNFHEAETARCVGYLFHTSKRNCGMAVIRVGESNDISWEDENGTTGS